MIDVGRKPGQAKRAYWNDLLKDEPALKARTWRGDSEDAPQGVQVVHQNNR